jgi:alcohol oxidase
MLALSGPLKVSYGGAFTNIGREFLDMAVKYDKGRPSISDLNSFHDANGYGVSLTNS